MKKLLSLFLLILSSFAYGLTADEWQSLRAHENRAEGSPGEVYTLAVIRAVANRLNLHVNERRFTELDNFFSYSANLEIYITGLSADEVIYAVPLNNPTASLAPALILLQEMAGGETPVVGARFLFLGAEKGDQAAYPIGSRQFLQSYAPFGTSAVIYLDLLSPSLPINLAAQGNYITPLWALYLARQALSNAGLNFTLPNNRLAAIRSNFFTDNHIIDNYHNLNYSAVLLSTALNANITEAAHEEEWAANLALALYRQHLSLNEVNTRRDINYLLAANFFISETVYIFIYLAIIFIMLTLLKPSHFKVGSYLKATIKYGGEFLLLFLLLFIFLFLATFFIKNLLLLKQSDEFWRHQPLLFMVVKLGFAVFFTNTSFRVVRFLGLANSPRLYNSAASLLVIINLIIFTLWNITFGLVWLWMVVTLAIFNRVKHSNLAELLIVVSYLPLTYVFIVFFITPFFNIAEPLLFSPIWGNLFISLVIFPNLLMALSIYHKQRSLQKRQAYQNFFSFVFLPLVVIVTFLLIYNYVPYSRGEPQPILVILEEEVNINRATLRLLSPEPLGNIDITIEDTHLPLVNLGRSALINLTPSTNFSLQASSAPILGRNQTQINLYSNRTPTRIELELIADRALGSIDANYPIAIGSLAETPNMATIFIGKNPPMPLQLNLIHERGLNFTLQITAFFADTFVEAPPRFNLTKEHQVSQTLPVVISH
ncbi:MAG: hypothetical protein FWE37_00895 [Spirochaetaceae bacterium]|nr:hypothetical protein [Spirochaetaceae bacterium]